jgi:hypothetical protein
MEKKFRYCDKCGAGGIETIHEQNYFYGPEKIALLVLEYYGKDVCSPCSIKLKAFEKEVRAESKSRNDKEI